MRTTVPGTRGRSPHRALLILAAVVIPAVVAWAPEAAAVGQAAGPPGEVVRFMTFNIHHGEGVDGRLDLARIADLIRTQNVDLVALQEVDKGTERTGRRDFPAELAAATGMTCVFGKNLDFQGGEYGNAVLSRLPVRRWSNTLLRPLRDGEQRGVLQVVVDAHGRELVFVSTHLDHRADDAERVESVSQIRAMIAPSPATPIVIGGDFNDTPGSRMHVGMAEQFVDSWSAVGVGDGFTIPSTGPKSRIDYLWIRQGAGLVVRTAFVPSTPASDHLPLVVEAAWSR